MRPPLSFNRDMRSSQWAFRHPVMEWCIFGIVWLVCALYVWHSLRRGWVPHDEGTLAQSAERVLNGELPHRDFDEIYTGGLSVLNAGAFRMLGVNLLTLRLTLYAVFLLWVPILYYIARRFAAPFAAGATVLLAVAWSLPNYSAAMPSWYNLFLTTFGVAALLRYLEASRRRWLVAAGICGGLSCLVKIVGVYYIAAVLLFLLYREQCLARPEVHRAERTRTWGYSITISAALLMVVAMLFGLVWRRLGGAEVIHFVVPGALLAGFLAWHEWSQPTAGGARRFRALAGVVVPFCIGVLLPITIALVPYIRSHAVMTVVQGVFVIPAKRLSFAAVRPFGGNRLLLAASAALLIGVGPYARLRLTRITHAIIGLGLVGVVLAAGWDGRIYRAIWDIMRATLPLIALVGVWLLVRNHARLSTLRRQQIVLLVGVTALCSLVQFPFSAPVYFFYVAPLAVLAALAIIMARPEGRRHGAAALLGLFLIFAVARIHPGYIYWMGLAYYPDQQNVRLTTHRGGIDVSAAAAADYDGIVRLLRAHASGEYIYAGPDAPQIYFLSGLRNPTRTLFDFFDDPNARAARVLSAIDAHRVTAIALNTRPGFSGPVPDDLVRALEDRYPESQKIGSFVVRWRR